MTKSTDVRPLFRAVGVISSLLVICAIFGVRWVGTVGHFSLVFAAWVYMQLQEVPY